MVASSTVDSARATGAPRLKVKFSTAAASSAKAAASASAGKGEKRTRKESRKTSQSKKRKKQDSDEEDYLEDEQEEQDLDDLDDEVEEIFDEGKSGDTFRLGEADCEFRDYSALRLKDDNQNRPLWVLEDGRIFLETYSPVYKQASDFLVAVAEPVCRPECVHEYQLTPHSLYAAVSIGLQTETIIAVLNKLSKVDLPKAVKEFIKASTENFGKVKLVLQQNRFFVESPEANILKKLLRDPVIQAARVKPADGGPEAGFTVRSGLHERGAEDLSAMQTVDLTAEQDAEAQAIADLEGPEEDTSTQLHSFEIDGSHVAEVKRQCLPGNLNYPMLEEYDFRNDSTNPPLAIDLKPTVMLRPFQARSMSKMFGNGRARSGIIVLPCGAGKSLTGISAAARIKKSVLVLCTNSVSVDQWRYQFTLWSTMQADQISRFTSEHKELLPEGAAVCVTTYTMIAFSGRRSEDSEKVMQQIQSREWGLVLLDEVHVVPAQMFSKVVSVTHSHCKLGLTATLVREDDRITNLNFLIGPKLYEANWLDLTREGHIANVQCAEVWCPMTREFMREYLRVDNAARRQLLYVMNPIKFQACQFLVQYHEQVRGDKIIVFSDNIFALTKYAQAMRRPFIYGGTSHNERTRILHSFKHNPNINTLFLSKVGDNSIDIPEANVLIQISSHAGSRRQEAQRLGRILRAKKTRAGVPVDTEEYNAFFYTLVSKDTQEMYYSTKRQQFLIDQGYAFKVITNLLDNAGAGAQLGYSTREEQVNLLAQVLVASEGEAAEEADDMTDDVATARKAVKRTQGSLASMSGASGLVYMEYESTGRGRGRGGGSKKEHSALFKRAMRR